MDALGKLLDENTDVTETRLHDAVVEAIRSLNAGWDFHRDSVNWDLVYEGTRLPPLLVLETAFELLGHKWDHKAGHQTYELLRQLGFAIEQKSESPPPSKDRVLNGPPTDRLNTIIYGPPGTGKTYATKEWCLRLCRAAPHEESDINELYDDLVDEGRVVFVTFHQSYGYEEFVEGLRPVAQDGTVAFRVRDGVLKRLARAASQARSATEAASSSPRSEAVSSFNQAWTELLGSIKQSRTVQTSQGKSYDIQADSDRILLTHARKSPRSVSRKDGQRLWGMRHLGHPDQLTVGTLTENWGTGRHAGYLWIIYRELWKIGQIATAAGRPTSSTSTRHPAYVLVIDEINRANVSKVMGELITLIEEDKRKGEPNEVTVTLPYSGKPFTLPANLHILGTMNTADRSIALLDTALRRRFHFEELAPQPRLLDEVEGVDLRRVLGALNDRLEYLIDRDHLIGHAWLMGAKSRQDIDDLFRHKIIPLIAEYFYDDWNRVRAVLGGGGHFITRERLSAPPGLGDDASEPRYRWQIRDEFPPEAYEGLIKGAEASE